ncbi:hypothetical protein GCM10028833_20500 [Glycomyces tarimensis]
MVRWRGGRGRSLELVLLWFGGEPVETGNGPGGVGGVGVVDGLAALGQRQKRWRAGRGWLFVAGVVGGAVPGGIGAGLVAGIRVAGGPVRRRLVAAAWAVGVPVRAPGMGMCSNPSRFRAGDL